LSTRRDDLTTIEATGGDLDVRHESGVAPGTVGVTDYAGVRAG
jgi:hypothetical protein